MEKYIHKVNFDRNFYTQTIYSVKQWDKGQVLRIMGLDLPPAIEINFSLNEKGGNSTPIIGTTIDKVTDVEIPSFILEKPSLEDYKAYAFIYPSTQNHAQTTHKIVMEIKAIPKPNDYCSPEDKKLFQDAIDAVNNTANKVEEATKQAPKIIDGFWYIWNVDKGQYENTGTQASGGSGSGTSNYKDLINKPKINNVELNENKTSQDLGLVSSEELNKLQEDVNGKLSIKQNILDKGKVPIVDESGNLVLGEVKATTNYNDLSNIPSINDVELKGNKTLDELGIKIPKAVSELNNDSNFQTLSQVENKGYQTSQDVENILTQKNYAVKGDIPTNVSQLNNDSKYQTQKEVEAKGYQTAQNVEEILTTKNYANKNDISNKLDKNQGAENSGKILGISADGNVLPVEKPSGGNLPLEPLTFTGGATGEYDGTNPLTVDIPTGGGGDTWVTLAEGESKTPVSKYFIPIENIGEYALIFIGGFIHFEGTNVVLDAIVNGKGGTVYSKIGSQYGVFNSIIHFGKYYVNNKNDLQIVSINYNYNNAEFGNTWARYGGQPIQNGLTFSCKPNEKNITDIKYIVRGLK